MRLIETRRWSIAPLVAAGLLGRAYAFELMRITVAVLVLVLVQIRNIYGFLVMMIARRDR